jgi:cell division transport system permease protein
MPPDIIPIGRSTPGRLLPWAASALLYAALLAFALAGASDSRMAEASHQPALASLSLPATTDTGRALADLNIALALLKGRPGITVAASSGSGPGPVEPWLGPADLGPSIAPATVEIAFDLNGGPDLAALASEASSLVPGARLAPVETDATLVLAEATPQRLLAACLGFGLLLLMAATVAGITALGCRDSSPTLDVVRTLGATEAWVARQFERQIARQLLRSCLPAGLAALVSIAAAPWLPGAALLQSLRPVDGVLLLCVPAAGLLLGMLAARTTARLCLRRIA